jgi:hypothetical protein
MAALVFVQYKYAVGEGEVLNTIVAEVGKIVARAKKL